MGSIKEFSQDNSSSFEVNVTAKATETSNYITDLLGELHSIANISGLIGLSEDIKDVIAKHV